MKRRTFLLSAGAAAMAQTQRPNIVFILSDDHRFDFIGAMGHPWLKGKTPNMDRMIRDGVHFRNAFVTTSLCSPSRASILTSQYIFRHGVLNNSTPLPASLPTFPALLQMSGYRTGFIGKWHMGGDDQRQPGFDHWFSFRGQGEYNDPQVNRNGERLKLSGYMADILTDEAVSFMRASRNQPFCLFLAHKNVHDPFLPAPRHRGQFRDLDIRIPQRIRISPPTGKRSPTGCCVNPTRGTAPRERSRCPADSSDCIAATARACLPSTRALARFAKRSNVSASPAGRCSST